MELNYLSSVDNSDDLDHLPFLIPKSTIVDGLAFIGLSLSRFNETPNCHSLTETRQSAFDFNEVQDRRYEFVGSTGDDGWLVGGGEPLVGSHKLPNKDSAHVEIMRVGTFDPSRGGVSMEEIQSLLSSGKILVPQMKVMPTAVVSSSHQPPELEVRFDLEREDSLPCEEWPNWQLMFLHNQLFEHFHYPARFCPGAFHM